MFKLDFISKGLYVIIVINFSLIVSQKNNFLINNTKTILLN